MPCEQCLAEKKNGTKDCQPHTLTGEKNKRGSK
jgi:hypothetical protein